MSSKTFTPKTVGEAGLAARRTSMTAQFTQREPATLVPSSCTILLAAAIGSFGLDWNESQSKLLQLWIWTVYLTSRIAKVDAFQ